MARGSSEEGGWGCRDGLPVHNLHAALLTALATLLAAIVGLAPRYPRRRPDPGPGPGQVQDLRFPEREIHSVPAMWPRRCAIFAAWTECQNRGGGVPGTSQKPSSSSTSSPTSARIPAAAGFRSGARAPSTRSVGRLPSPPPRSSCQGGAGARLASATVALIFVSSAVASRCVEARQKAYTGKLPQCPV